MDDQEKKRKDEGWRLVGNGGRGGGGGTVGGGRRAEGMRDEERGLFTLGRSSHDFCGSGPNPSETREEQRCTHSPR